MKKILGQYFLPYRNEISISDSLFLQDNSDFVDKVYNDVVGVMKEAYGEENLIVDDNSVFYEVGGEKQSKFGVVKDDVGVWFLIFQPIYRKDKETLRTLKFLIVPKFQDVNKSINLYFGNFSLELTASCNIGYDWLCGNSSFKQDVEVFSTTEENGWSEFKNSCSKGLSTTEYKGNFYYYLKTNSVNVNLFLDFLTSIVFLEDAVFVNYGSKIEVKNTVDFLISAGATFASSFDDISKDNTAGIVDPLEIVANEEFDSSLNRMIFNTTYEIFTNNLKITSLEEVSNVKPIYKVNDVDLAKLKNFIGYSVFVCDYDNQNYVNRIIVDAYQDDNGNVYLVLNDFIPYDLSNVVIFSPVSNDLTVKLKDDILIADEVDGTKLYSGKFSKSDFSVCQTLSVSVDVSLNATIQDVLNKSTLEDGTKLVDYLGFIQDAFEEKPLECSTFIIPMPLLPVSQESFEQMPYEIDYLDLDLIDDAGDVAIVKPILVSTKHPSGNGYVVIGKIPNIYATKIKEKIGYYPAKIFINPEDRLGASYTANLGVLFMEDNGKGYSLYFEYGSIDSDKPFVSFAWENR